MTNLPYATLESYGYKDTRKIKSIIKILRNIFVIIIVFSLYIPVIMLLLQSVNSSPNISEFGHFTLDWYINMFAVRSLKNAIINTLLTSFVATILATVIATFMAVGIYALRSEEHTSEPVTSASRMPSSA